MKRHYFVSDDLDDLEHVEEELERDGLVSPQIHVLSRDDAGVAQRPHLHEVEAVIRSDLVRSMKRGAIAGIIGAPSVLLLAYFLGLAEEYTWTPFIFLSIVVLSFSTWEGGLFGIQVPHYQFKQFEQDLAGGKHIFFVDVEGKQKEILDRVVSNHPRLAYNGQAKGSVGWFVKAHQAFRHVKKPLA
ncbi:MAG: NAD/FAD-utilizing enzyme [Gammaproteobacteria bacterium]|nr:MAG: NAD/FAD-utilizing enzyme [Gammaproteobacteria bacterium]RLA50972.1 MAG: NAD/FAD-utilizing enzyme [Gammaproteobacteria bacterium]